MFYFKFVRLSVSHVSLNLCSIFCYHPSIFLKPATMDPMLLLLFSRCRILSLLVTSAPASLTLYLSAPSLLLEKKVRAMFHPKFCSPTQRTCFASPRLLPVFCSSQSLVRVLCGRSTRVWPA